MINAAPNQSLHAQKGFVMKWQELCNRPDLQNLPFKIELDEQGKVIMSPVKVCHSALQGEMAAILRLNRKDGKILTECAIQTRKGTKVADVSWVSRETYQIRNLSNSDYSPH